MVAVHFLAVSVIQANTKTQSEVLHVDHGAGGAPRQAQVLVSEGVECLVLDIISGPDRWKGSGVSPGRRRRRISSLFWEGYYQTQVSLQGTGSEPLGLGPSSSVENRNSLACLPG